MSKSKQEREDKGDSFGVHRVLDQNVCLPQSAERLDNRLPIFPNEILVSVEKLNIDAASFVQMEQATSGDARKIGELILENAKTRGKQQNPVTGSGGMLIGEVTQIGSEYKGPLKVKVGDRIASLISLTLTPLHLEKILAVNLKTHQVDVQGHAVLFESSIGAILPKNIDENIAMAVFDVAGAPATVNSLCGAGQTLIVIGAGGKAGILSCVAGRQKVGKRGKVIAIEPFPKAAEDLATLKICDEILTVDAKDPVAVHSGVHKATHGKMGDVVINVASVPHTEISTILSARQGARRKSKVVFFSMATSFTRVALGAEGIAADSELIFGNGYYPDHANFAVGLLRKNKRLRELFSKRYSK
jgi:L-erythro-3,5-diaminohexanoate dehydrogenase